LTNGICSGRKRLDLDTTICDTSGSTFVLVSVP
jgi:hypothetical protein